MLRHLDAPEDDLDAPFQAALALEGHPRVLDSEGAPVAVRRVQAGLDWTADSVGGLTMYLRLGPQRLTENEAQDLLKRAPTSNYLAQFEPGRLLVAEMPPGAMELLFALSQRGWSYPPEAVGPLLERVQDISRLLPIHLDAGLRGEPVARDPRPLVRLDAMGNGTLAIDLRVRPLPDGPAFPPGEGPEELSVVRPDGRVYVRRPLDVETADLADVLGELPGLAPPYLSWRRYIDDPEEALDLVQCLQERPDAVQVEWAGERRRVSRPAEASDLNLGMGPGRDWLQLTGFADVDGLVVDLAVLLAAIREGRRFVRVDDAAWMRISDRLRDQLEDLAAATWTGRKGLELSPLAGGLLEGLAAEGAEVDPPPEWILDREKVRQAQSLTLSPPLGLRAELRPYQQVGAEWMARLAHWAPGACLADDMGLGKTLQAITLLLRRASEGPALVVAPTSVGFNWRAEIARFAPSLQVLAYRDSGREKLLREAGPHTVFITSYDIVHRDVEALSAQPWRTLVLDEAQAIKNPDTRRAKAIFQLPADFVLALTGTPVENRTGELWSLMRAVAPGLLGSAGAFRERFAIPIERLQDTRRQAALSSLLRPFLLRRLKRDVAPELPPRQEQVVVVELSLAERALYNRARLEAIAELSGPDAGDPEVRRFRVLAALTRLRQLACHPKLAEPDSPVPSSKLEALLELLDEAHEGGHKALVFSQFTKHLDLVQAALTAQGRTILRLDGSTPASERQARVQAFQRGNTDAFLLSLKAGGTGLNLTAATVVLHLDPWWNPAVEDQATDRAHRIGQSEPVTVYRLVSQATVEEAILELHAEKRALVASLLEGTGSPARFGTEELMRLLG